jgi:hypothetical protein
VLTLHVQSPDHVYFCIYASTGFILGSMMRHTVAGSASNCSQSRIVVVHRSLLLSNVRGVIIFDMYRFRKHSTSLPSLLKPASKLIWGSRTIVSMMASGLSPFPVHPPPPSTHHFTVASSSPFRKAAHAVWRGSPCEAAPKAMAIRAAPSGCTTRDRNVVAAVIAQVLPPCMCSLFCRTVATCLCCRLVGWYFSCCCVACTCRHGVKLLLS